MIENLYTKGGFTEYYDVAAGESITFGNQVALNATAQLVEATDTTAITVIGIAMQTVDNTAGGDGDKECLVLLGAVVSIATSGLVETDITHTVYVLDAETVTTQDGTTNAIQSGVLMWIDTVNNIGKISQ